MIEVYESIAALRERLKGVEGIALVATMGALHDGHLALVRRARELSDTVVVSIFVNPLQFGEGEDFDRYPRDLESDLEALPEGTIVFAPPASELYPDGPVQTRVAAGPVGELFEGAFRPGHFDGMLTVVAKLFAIVQPTVACFGRKDAQQAFLVERMVLDLNFPLSIELVDTVREDDGLALSSRNRFLSPDERVAARALSASLASAAARSSASEARSAAHGVLSAERMLELDYFELVDPHTFLPIDDDHAGEALAIVAARVGATRLIDNRTIALSAPR